MVGPLKIWLHSPELADRAQKLGAYVRFHSALPAELSELAILLTARLWQADFEWSSHVGPARAVHAVARELHEARALSDETHALAEGALGRRGLVDLVGVLGYYTLVSMTLKAFDVPSPEGSDPFAD